MNIGLHTWNVASLWLALHAPALAAEPVIIKAPNVVPISARLVTAGQPNADALSRLGAQGFEAVIYLAPPTVPDAIADEPEIVRKQGLEFVNIPIKFGSPTEDDVRAFFDLMEKFKDKKLLVHCQVNMRASSLTFLHRVIVLREKPEEAYGAVTKVWSPRGPWKALLISQLQKAGIAFDPY